MAQPIPSSDTRDFPARFAAVAETADFALSFCERHGIGRPAAMRLRLVIEELFTNSIQHGYRGECDTPVHIGLAMIDGYLTVEYEDSAPALEKCDTARDSYVNLTGGMPGRVRSAFPLVCDEAIVMSPALSMTDASLTPQPRTS